MFEIIKWVVYVVIGLIVLFLVWGFLSANGYTCFTEYCHEHAQTDRPSHVPDIHVRVVHKPIPDFRTTDGPDPDELDDQPYRQEPSGQFDVHRPVPPPRGMPRVRHFRITEFGNAGQAYCNKYAHGQRFDHFEGGGPGRIAICLPF